MCIDKAICEWNDKAKPSTGAHNVHWKLEVVIVEDDESKEDSLALHSAFAQGAWMFAMLVNN